MTLDAFNAFCAGLPATFHVVQWGEADVWKVGEREETAKRSKVFAMARWDDDDGLQATFKVSEIAFEALRDAPGLRPAPYLASRGLKWIQRYAEPGLSDDALKEQLREAHRLAALNLPKRLQRALGLA